MPSYSQYKRQMAVMDADDANIETWITVKGNHIPIMKGQSKEEAVQSFLEKKGKSSGGAKTVMKPDVEKPGSTTVVSKGSGKAKYKVGDVTKQGKIKEVIPARLSDTPYYKLENGKTYLEEELGAKPASFNTTTKVPSASREEFMKSQKKKYDTVTGTENGTLLSLYYEKGSKPSNHVGTYNHQTGEYFHNAPSAEKPAFRELKGTKHQGGTIGLSKEEHNRIEEYNKWARKETRRVKSGEAAREANARPILKADENADVSDIVKQYKADMKALGENASAAKQNKVEVNAIKEFMRRKVGAGHPYEDYYNYWLRGMSKNDSDAFNSIYGESENREKAFEALTKEKDKHGSGSYIKVKGASQMGSIPDNVAEKHIITVKEKTIGEMEKAGENVSHLKQAMQHVHYGFYEEKGKKMTPTQFKEFLKSEQEKNAGKNDYYANRTKQRYPEAEKLANKGWMNARSSHPETIGKVVRRVVKKIGEQRKPKSVAEKLGINWEEFEDLERGSSMSQEITQMASRKPKK